VVPPGSGDGLQGAKKGVMEIADLIVVNKFDGDYKPVCRGLQRKLQSALTLTRTKHSDWYAPVELVSAELGVNIDCIWEHALRFREEVGADYLLKRR
jgi:LAO/AO transport system kinase